MIRSSIKFYVQSEKESQYISRNITSLTVITILFEEINAWHDSMEEYIYPQTHIHINIYMFHICSCISSEDTYWYNILARMTRELWLQFISMSQELVQRHDHVGLKSTKWERYIPWFGMSGIHQFHIGAWQTDRQPNTWLTHI